MINYVDGQIQMLKKKVKIYSGIQENNDHDFEMLPSSKLPEAHNFFVYF